MLLGIARVLLFIWHNKLNSNLDLGLTSKVNN